MPTFSWTTRIPNLPETWSQTKGAGVKIALFDTGVFLDHPCFEHLSTQAHLYDMNARAPSGKDTWEISNPHGTLCASIIAGKPQGVGAVEGLAYEAEFFIFNVAEKSTGNPTLGLFAKALRKAIDLGIDIISVPNEPLPDSRVPKALLEGLFQEIAEKKILLVASAANTSNLESLNFLNLPANRTEVLTVAALKRVLVRNWKPEYQLNSLIQFVFPPVLVSVCDGGLVEQFKQMSSSFANAAVAGIAALALSEARTTSGEADFRFTLDEMEQKIADLAETFQPDLLLQAQNPTIYYTKTTFFP